MIADHFRKLFGRPPITDVLVALFFAGLFAAVFSPVILNGRLLAPGDGIALFLPYYYGSPALWDSNLGTGFPLASEPQAMTWYPLKLLFSLAPGSWNIFILTAYVLGAFLMYKYVLHLTGDRYAGFIAGIAYGLSGFLIARLGHVAFLHAACWAPGVLLGSEKALRNGSLRSLAFSALCLSMMLFSGHPQLVIYVGLLYLARMLFIARTERLAPGQWVPQLLTVTALSAGVTAVQFVSSRQMAAETVRDRLSYSTFAQYSAHPVELLSLFFPYLFGGVSNPSYPAPYFGWNWCEGFAFTGFFVAILAVVAVAIGRTEVRFWLYAGLATLLLATDGYTPLAALLYHIPGYNLFRCHGRWLLLIQIAGSVLAGYGIYFLSSLSRTSAEKIRLAVRVLLFPVIVFFVLYTLSPMIEQKAAGKGLTGLRISVLANPAVRIPAYFAAVACLTTLCWVFLPPSRILQAATVVVLLTECSSFALNWEWRYWSPPSQVLQPQTAIAPYAAAARATQHSLLAAVSRELATYEDAPVNLAKMWNWSTLSFYTPLFFRRYQDVLNIAPSGNFIDDWRVSASSAYALAGARFVYLGDELTKRPTKAYNNLQLPEHFFDITLRHGTATPESLPIGFSMPADTTRILLVGALAGSTGIRDGEVVAIARVFSPGEEPQFLPIRAGLDTSEWAYDCPDVKPAMRHRLAAVFASYAVHEASRNCDGHDYVTTLLPSSLKAGSHMTLQYTNPSGFLMLKQIWFVDSGGRARFPGIASTLAADSQRWILRASTAHGSVYEMAEPMPRAWTVPSVLTLPAESILHVIQAGTLPDGSRFDPSAVALVESSQRDGNASLPAIAALALTKPRVQSTADRLTIMRKVSVRDDGSRHLEIHVDSGAPSLLVLRDMYYPGWTATVNGQPAAIYRTNYIQRGLILPAGPTDIAFRYRPVWVYIGLLITALSAAVMMALLFWPRRLKNKTGIENCAL